MPSLIVAARLVFLASLLSPIVLNLVTLPADYPEPRSTHPSTRHRPPRSYIVTEEQHKKFVRDGIVVLRNVLPVGMAHALNVAGHDVVQ